MADITPQSPTNGSEQTPRRPRFSRPHRRPEGQNRPVTNSETQPVKQTNQQDRYARTLSQHGARPLGDRDRSQKTEHSPNSRPYSNRHNTQQGQSAQPRPNQVTQNPRLAEGRPILRRTPSQSKPQSQSSSGGGGRISRRRFQVSNERPKYTPSYGANVTPVVMQSGSRQLRIIPLGGAGEVGSKNMTVFEYGDDILIVDCGIAFPDKDQWGIDALIPDVRYLEERKNNIRGMVFTHGHEDHIGSIAHILPRLNCPLYATPLAGGLIKHKLEEAGIKNANLTVVQAGDKVHFGKISVEMVRLTHSIPDVLGLAIRCPSGLFFYATDWRLEHTPTLGKPADWTRIAQLAGEGITALFSDSTNVDRPGYSPTERVIGEAFDRIFQDAPGRIIIAQFASNINRIQQILNSAKKFSRKVALSGRSMETYVNIAMGLGYLSIPEGMLVDLRKLGNIDAKKLVVLSTGSQGEEFSSLTRISEGEHRHVKLDPSDTIVLSASTIPGNEGAVGKVLDNLYREGVNVINNKVMTDVHVSGHPSRDELKMMIALAQPKFFIPIHGDYFQMVEHGKVAVEMGVDQANVLLMENGQVVEFDERGGRISSERIQLEDIMIDGLGIGDVGPVVIRDRHVLGKEGMVTVLLIANQKTGELMASPDIITRGFIYIREAESLMHQLRDEVKKIYADVRSRPAEEIKEVMRDRLSQFVSQHTGRNPMILPVITTV